MKAPIELLDGIIPTALKTLGMLAILLTQASCVVGEWGLKDLQFQSLYIKTPEQTFDNREITGGKPVPFDKLLMVNFHSQHGLNLYNIAERFAYSVWENASLCTSGAIEKNQLIVTLVYVYGEFGQVQQYNNPLADYPYISQSFHIYILPKNERECFTNPCSIKYDLVSNPHDICFKISGGALLTKPLESNVVLVPKSALIAAFGAAHIPHGQ